MDMEFMDAGKTSIAGNYKSQMEGLKKIKHSSYGDLILPFVFIDPRRIELDQNKVDDILGQVFFKWTANDGKVTLGECFIKEYIEKEKFSGFKIYPALGYFPFDEKLLPLWKYAADNGIPITTHCIRGTIYYRGKKQKDWNYHKVFKQKAHNAHENYDNMFLPNQDNADFSNDFTHPLNYLCLLNPILFTDLVAQSSQEVKDLFEYNPATKTVKHNLSQLKICLAHFGGDDEWKKFLESDKNNYSRQLVEKPDFGITFIKNNSLIESYGTLENIWRYVDWYSIITSMMLQYDNVYADISYIVHNTEIFPLLKQTLHNEELKSKVLFGTDFYVVRNHLTEKEMLANTLANLSKDEFDSIARENPHNFLKQIEH
jgi:predicted TIM-barrel fold metal-dependent hydrolase